MIELLIHGIKSTSVEPLSDLLTDLGALSITLMDSADCPVLEPAPGETPLWPDVELKALFQDELQVSLCEQVILLSYPGLKTQRHLVQPQDWENEWKKQAKPLCFGERLWVKPSHASSSTNTIDVILDPGLAFGTGSHPTTALCLKWLDRQSLENKTLIDYGCGTGILMIAALKLGAQYAYGVDIDPQAILATKQNLASNAIKPEQFRVGDVNSIEKIQPVDILLANILFNPLVELQERFYQALKPNGELVVSGILSEQIEPLIQAYQSKFDALDIQQFEQWGMIVFSKN